MENENAELQAKAQRAADLLKQTITLQEIEESFFKEPQVAYDKLLAYELKRMDGWLCDLLHQPEDDVALNMIHAKRDELQSRVRALMVATAQPGEEPRTVIDDYPELET